MEIAPDDHELNYDEHHMATGTVDQLRQVNSVFNERHMITDSQVRDFGRCCKSQVRDSYRCESHRYVTLAGVVNHRCYAGRS